ASRPVTPLRPPDRHLPGEEIASGLRYFETRHEAPSMPGRIDASFAKGFDTIGADQVLCFDTETTGLAGGTGTRAFMIGAADRVDGQLRIRQLMTTTLAAERAMLEAFARWLAPETVLVSYNGRSYDAPLLKTRYRLARMPCPISPLAHLDLLHPVRRRYRGQWENCRLATVERRLLQVLREDDLPGSEAPRAWRDYLQGGPATDLRRVLAHNHTDVRSLMQLLARLVLPTL
ncbi:MAG TPA: ribonuclease H-like domain-containing protein, partial [Arenimonas sp.]|nr:ribonuclease H-like domain-containing protein [Arenimonas sp.]